MLLDRLLRIISIIMEVPIEELNKETSPDNIEKWDSLKHMNLILALEEEFNIAFSDEEIVEMLSVEIIVEILKEKGGLDE